MKAVNFVKNVENIGWVDCLAVQLASWLSAQAEGESVRKIKNYKSSVNVNVNLWSMGNSCKQSKRKINNEQVSYRDPSNKVGSYKNFLLGN